MPTKGIFYDENKKELMGSDSMFVCDGRLNRHSIIMDAKRHRELYKKHLKHIYNKMVYLRLYKGSLRNPSFYTGYIDLRE
jgi:hypothetical protein